MSCIKYLISNMFVVLICGTISISSALASSVNTHHTHSMLELKPYSLDNSYKTAGVHWLPDYQSDISGSVALGNGGSGTKPKSCEDMGYKTTKSAQEVCETKRPGFGLTCYANCRCPSQYVYIQGLGKSASGGCPNGQTTNSDCCGGKCTGCVDCPKLANWANIGWKPQRPSSSNVYGTYTGDACLDVYFDCGGKYTGLNSGEFRTLADIAPRGNHPSGPWRWSSKCRTGQKAVNTGTETAPHLCQKCVSKTCTDYNPNYTYSPVSGKKCTQVPLYEVDNINCYNCVDCADEYKYTREICKKEHVGFENWRESFELGARCGGLSNKCYCSPNTNCSEYNLNSNSCTGGTIGKSCNDGCQLKWKCDPAPCANPIPSDYSTTYPTIPELVSMQYRLDIFKGKTAWKVLTHTDSCGKTGYKLTKKTCSEILNYKVGDKFIVDGEEIYTISGIMSFSDFNEYNPSDSSCQPEEGTYPNYMLYAEDRLDGCAVCKDFDGGSGTPENTPPSGYVKSNPSVWASVRDCGTYTAGGQSAATWCMSCENCCGSFEAGKNNCLPYCNADTKPMLGGYVQHPRCGGW